MVKILVFAGSTRKDSVNKKVARTCTKILEGLGTKATFIDLKDYDMPLYDGDIEEEKGLPKNTKKLKEVIKEHEGLVIVSPEYNAGMSGVLKNVIDWVTRKEQGEEALLAGKTAAILAATPGSMGGIRGLYHLRHVLTGIRMQVLPTQLGIPNAYGLFDEQGKINDEETKEKITNYMKELIKLSKKLND